jgi:hypothetical protein
MNRKKLSPRGHNGASATSGVVAAGSWACLGRPASEG